MKKHLLFIFMLTLGISTKAAIKIGTPLSTIDEITFKDSRISLAGKLLGKFDVKTKDLNVSNKEKTTIYEVTIFDEGGATVAKLDLQVIDKSKRKNCTIVEANLKTLRDNVSHNSSNFINYEERGVVKNKEFEVPQFDNVVKYLLSYNYF